MIVFIIFIVLCIPIFAYTYYKFNKPKPVKQSFEKKLLDFLNKADDAYIWAYQHRVLGSFKDYATAEVAQVLQQRILYYNNRIWGSAKLRTREWKIISKTPTEVIVCKHVSFSSIRMGNISVSLSEPCTEYWKIYLDDNLYMEVGAIEC